MHHLLAGITLNLPVYIMEPEGIILLAFSTVDYFCTYWFFSFCGFLGLLNERWMDGWMQFSFDSVFSNEQNDNYFDKFNLQNMHFLFIIFYIFIINHHIHIIIIIFKKLEYRDAQYTDNFLPLRIFLNYLYIWKTIYIE